MGSPHGRPLLIRADADVRIGTGHVMRLLALAQAWMDAGGAVTLASAALPEALAQSAAAAGVGHRRIAAPAGSREDARATAAAADAVDAAWVAVDGYAFDTAYQRTLREAGRPLLCLDDYGHAGEYVADLICNPNAHAAGDLYGRRAACTRLLLGPRYVLLRREFLALRDRRPEPGAAAGRVLVTMGGSDPDNATLWALRALRHAGAPVARCAAVVGPGNPHTASLRVEAAQWGGRLQLVAAPPHMPALMADADVAVAAGGTTALELAFMGVPSVLFVLADNQAPGARRLAELGVAVSLGRPGDAIAHELGAAVGALLGDAAGRDRMRAAGRALVDGYGGERLLANMGGVPAVIRLARAEDSRGLWAIANDPSVRAVSFSTDPIPWEQHVAWFAAHLSDERCRFWVAEDRDSALVGQVRVERRGQMATISVSVLPAARGRGMGLALVRKAVAATWTDGSADAVQALVLPANAASRRLFERAGFALEGAVSRKGHEALQFVLRRREGE